MNIFFTSDTHYNHKNIVRGTTEWTVFEKGSSHQRTRDFETLQEHNAALVKSINGMVGKDDTLYHLGDWSFGGFDSIMEFRKQLKCQNIHLIYGNHDHHIENNKGGIQGAFKSVGHYKEVRVGTHHFILSHFAMRVWNKSHKGSIMLYGHSHGTLDEYTPAIANPTWIGDEYFIKNYRTMDVGVDTNNLYPYHLDEIVDIMTKKDVLLEVDHHNISTN